MKMTMRDGSGVREYRYLIEDMDRHGTVRIYFRRRKKGAKIRIKLRPGTAQFHQAYMRLLSESAEPPKADKKVLGQIVQGMLLWLVAQYYRSTEFMRLNEETRKVKRRILDQLCERAQNRQISTLEPRHVAAWRDEKKDAPESANSRVNFLRALFGWACQPEIALASHNPAREVKTLKSKNPGGHKTWTEALAKQFELAFPLGTKARLAFDLLVFTGARISDVHKFGPQMERDGKLCFTETKGFGVVDAEKKHELPILPALRASIDAYYAAHPSERHLCYLMTEFGAPYSLKGLGNWFGSQCRLAKIPPRVLSAWASQAGSGAVRPRRRDGSADDGAFRLDHVEADRRLYQGI